MRESLILRLKKIVEDSDEEFKDVDRASALKELLKWDKEYAETKLTYFVENDSIWAIKLALVIADNKRNSVAGLGIDEGDMSWKK